MATCALIALDQSGVNGVVVNTIVADPAVDPAPEFYLLVAIPDGAQVSIGWSYSNGAFAAPTE